MIKPVFSLFTLLLLCSFIVVAQSNKKAMDLYYKGEMAEEFGQKDDAIIYFTKAIELDSTLFEAFFSRGLMYYNQEKYDLAVIDFSATIKLNSEHKQAYYLRGRTKQQQEKYERAILDYEQASMNRPNHAKTYYSWAYCLHNTNKPVLACKYWNKSENMGFDSAKELKQFCK